MKTLKKAIATLTAITSFATMSAISGQCITADATSTPSLYMTSSVVSTGKYVDNVYVPSGSYQVSVCIKNNTGFALYGLRVLGSNLNFISNSTGVACEDGLSSPEIAVNTNCLTFTYGKSYNKFNDGVLFTFYVNNTSSSSNIELDIDSFCNLAGNTVIASATSVASGGVTSSTSYTKGDVNADSNVNSTDSSLLLSALSNHSVSSVSTATVDSNISSWFPNISVANQIDVDDDGYLNNTDSTLILQYYAAHMAHNTYTGNIGRIYYYID